MLLLELALSTPEETWVMGMLLLKLTPNVLEDWHSFDTYSIFQRTLNRKMNRQVVFHSGNQQLLLLDMTFILHVTKGVDAKVLSVGDRSARRPSVTERSGYFFVPNTNCCTKPTSLPSSEVSDKRIMESALSSRRMRPKNIVFRKVPVVSCPCLRKRFRYFAFIVMKFLQNCVQTESEQGRFPFVWMRETRAPFAKIGQPLWFQWLLLFLKSLPISCQVSCSLMVA